MMERKKDNIKLVFNWLSFRQYCPLMENGDNYKENQPDWVNVAAWCSFTSSVLLLKMCWSVKRAAGVFAVWFSEEIIMLHWVEAAF